MMIKKVLLCLAMAALAVAVFVGLSIAESHAPRIDAVDGVCQIEEIPQEPTLLSGWRQVDNRLELDLYLAEGCEELYILRPSRTSATLLVDGSDGFKALSMNSSMFRVEGGGTTHRLTLFLNSVVVTNSSYASIFAGSPEALTNQLNSTLYLRLPVVGLEFAALFFSFCLWLKKRSETYLLAFGAYTVFELLHVLRQTFRGIIESPLLNAAIDSSWFVSPWGEVLEFCLLYSVLRQFVPVRMGRVNYVWIGLAIWAGCMLTETFSGDPAATFVASALFHPVSSALVLLVLAYATLFSERREHLPLLLAWSVTVPIFVFNWTCELGLFGTYSIGARFGLCSIADSIQLMSILFVICTKFAGKFVEAEALSVELEQVNAGLEQAVKDKTAELVASYDSLKREQRRRDEFISNVAHNIKTPLFSVTGYCEMASSCIETDPAQAAGYVDIARSNADRAQATVKELLLATRLENRRLQFVPVRVDACTLAQRAVANVLPQAQLEGVPIEVSVPPTGQLFCQVDGTYIGQAIENIVENAVESCQSGGHVLVEVLEMDGFVAVKVCDSGCGMDEDAIGHVFERYWSDKHGHRSGTGLGLPIARDIVEQNGGSIEAQSEPEKGSVFTVKLPVCQE